MVSRRVSESDLTALISYETVQSYTLCESLFYSLSGLLSAGLWRQLRLLLYALRYTMALPCSPSNGILSVVALGCSFMVLFFSLYCDIASAPLLFPHPVASGFFSGFSPPSLLSLSPTHLMSRTVRWWWSE